MAKKRKHSRAEILAKIAEADDLATQGKLQSEIAHTLGVSFAMGAALNRHLLRTPF